MWGSLLGITDELKGWVIAPASLCGSASAFVRTSQNELAARQNMSDLSEHLEACMRRVTALTSFRKHKRAQRATGMRLPSTGSKCQSTAHQPRDQGIEADTDFPTIRLLAESKEWGSPVALPTWRPLGLTGAFLRSGLQVTDWPSANT